MSIEERQLERAQCSFNTRLLTNFLDGGKEQTQKLERMMLQLERDPAFSHRDEFKLNWEQQRELCFLRISKIVPYLETEDEETFTKRFGLLSIADGSTATRLGVHYGLFIQTIRALGTSEQFQHWVIDKGAGRVSNFYGCFGMTELAHGSNVAKLQTTATFDESFDGFIINTPNLGATKWWIGGAAHSATHCVVYARLISNGKDYGIKNFVVQLRDVKNGQLLTGISIGDIGKKMGRDGVDNGWIQFSNVRIPRFNMLAKHTKIDEEGIVVQPKFEQLGYSALVIGRVSMVNDSYNVGKRFITIALRYATQRRQFGKDASGLEKKIIDYPHHRRRLLPLLAVVYAMNSSSNEVTKFNNKVQELVRSGSADISQVVPNLKDLFSLSAGMKAFSTWETCKIIDESRQSCGGHGYSSYNGFGSGYSDWVVQCTWEGDNNVLSLSCGRALIQTYLNIQKGQKAGVYSDFLVKNFDKDFKLSIQSLNDTDAIINAWELTSKKLITKAAQNFVNFSKEFDIETSFEKVSSNRFEIAKIYTHLMILKTFKTRVTKEASKEVSPVLNLLVQLYGLHITSQNLSQFYAAGLINDPSFSDELNFKIDDINERLRPDIIGLTDAFNLSDYFINSQIGKYNGDIYETYFKYVNDQVQDKVGKPYYYDSLYSPFLKRDLSPNDNEEREEE